MCGVEGRQRSHRRRILDRAIGFSVDRVGFDRLIPSFCWRLCLKEGVKVMARVCACASYGNCVFIEYTNGRNFTLEQ